MKEPKYKIGDIVLIHLTEDSVIQCRILKARKNKGQDWSYVTNINWTNSIKESNIIKKL
jgi:hypothetical protein